ncbi:ATP-binding protein [uncultured Alteromonas sp.]|jgi:two-component system sensor histidine kinase PhoQ|uniref:ATP-binding protein n=1 Tax=uncultured Alteromonas sp. TaxID=179113 RepID=UPI0030D87D89
MKQLSLRIRSILLAMGVLALFAPLTVVILDDAYTTSLTQAKMSELRLMNLGLLSAFELDDDIPFMPEILYEEQLNLPGSGYLGVIVFRGHVVWQSASALDYTLPAPNLNVNVGNELFVESYIANFDNDTDYFAYAFTAEFASESNFEPVRFYIFNNKHLFNEERETFISVVWRWLLILSGGLLVLIIVGISLVLMPVRKLISEISLTSSGQKQQLDAHYPVEFNPLKQSINELIESESQQRARYKNSLGDLAHSLKTPLAVALGVEKLPKQAVESLNQIDQIIQRQLKRASAGKTGWQAAIPLLPITQKVANAMDKVYQHKQLSITIEAINNVAIKADETDIMEMVGNLLDNACKAADSKVLVALKNEGNWAVLTIDDDGPGIPSDKKQALLERGTRLDTYADGQGIGMALVSDLIAIYQGKLLIERAPIGGARFIVKFPV